MGVRRAAAYLSLSRHTLYERVGKRQIPHIKMWRKLLFDKQDLDAWLQVRKVSPRERP